MRNLRSRETPNASVTASRAPCRAQVARERTCEGAATDEAAWKEPLVGDARLRVEKEGMRERIENEEGERNSVSMSPPSAGRKKIKRQNRALGAPGRCEAQAAARTSACRQLGTDELSFSGRNRDAVLVDCMHENGRPTLERFDLGLDAPVALVERLGGVEEARQRKGEGIQVAGFGDAENLELSTRVARRFKDDEARIRDEAGWEDEGDWWQGPRVAVEFCESVGRETAALLLDQLGSALESSPREGAPPQLEGIRVFDHPR